MTDEEDLKLKAEIDEIMKAAGGIGFAADPRPVASLLATRDVADGLLRAGISGAVRAAAKAADPEGDAIHRAPRVTGRRR